MGNRAFVSVTGSADCNGVWALAHWTGKIYRFRSTGEVYEVTLATPLAVTTLPGPDGGAGIVFSGAASSTAPPIH